MPVATTPVSAASSAQTSPATTNPAGCPIFATASSSIRWASPLSAAQRVDRFLQHPHKSVILSAAEGPAKPLAPRQPFEPFNPGRSCSRPPKLSSYPQICHPEQREGPASFVDVALASEIGLGFSPDITSHHKSGRVPYLRDGFIVDKVGIAPERSPTGRPFSSTPSQIRHPERSRRTCQTSSPAPTVRAVQPRSLV